VVDIGIKILVGPPKRSIARYRQYGDSVAADSLQTHSNVKQCEWVRHCTQAVIGMWHYTDQTHQRIGTG